MQWHLLLLVRLEPRSAEQVQHDEQQPPSYCIRQFNESEPPLFRDVALAQAAIRAETARFARCSQVEKGAGGSRRPLAASRSR
jgi:hypothetical protein